jgi:diguanylate cyclase (GGDEF)-like protein/PAS domain S-box-containing protein
MKSRHLILYTAIISSIAAAFWFIMQQQRQLINEPLHSTMEAVEALSVLLLALFLLGRREEGDKLTPPALGLLMMGIINSFHAISLQGDQFVFLRAVASLAGGLGFSLIWLPSSSGAALRETRVLWAVIAGSLALCVYAFFFPSSLPVMVQQGTFTTGAITINILGGVLFIIGTGRFVLDLHRSNESEDLLFSLVGIFFGLAGLTFQYSMLWSESWWFWHGLRLLASVLVLVFLGHRHLQTTATIKASLSERKQAEQSLIESEARFRSMASATLDAFILIDNDGNVTFWNDSAAKMFGYTKEEITGKYLHSFIMPERYIDSFRRGFEAFQFTGEGPFIGKVYEVEAERKDGTEFPVELSLAALKLKGNWCAVGIVRDITERRRLEHSLRRSYEVTKAIIDSMKEAISLIDVRDFRIVGVNSTFLKEYGYSDESEILGQHCYAVTHHRSDVCGPPDDICPLTETVRMGGHYTVEHLHYGKNGEKIYVEITTSPIMDESGKVVQVVHVQRNITERKMMEEKIRHQAYHDELTDLPNRRFFMDIVSIEIPKTHRSQKKLAILFLDLDRFKEVNDTLGHEAGDQLLKEVSGRLKACIRESDTLARMGGDEFNILLADISRTEDITIIVRKIMNSFQKRYRIAGHDLPITTSIGISIYPDDGKEMDTLFRYADIAMYHAKEMGKNTYRFYNPAINIQSIERMKMEGYLHQAIERGEFSVYYQPQIDIRTGNMVCAEALVRWKHPDLGMLSPNRFIPAAEETGFVKSIDEWVLRTACAQFKKWHMAGYPPLCVTVNLSAREFQNPGLVATIAEILEETGLQPECLDIEVTESMAMRDIEHTVRQLNELAAMKVRISVDDFGTGYSSLNYLKRLPIHRLKIDQSFVKDITTDPDDRAIIQAVTAMAHNMKLKVVAEGVETEEQLDFLQKSQCDEAQGFIYSKPLPAEEFEELITHRKWLDYRNRVTPH